MEKRPIRDEACDDYCWDKVSANCKYRGRLKLKRSQGGPADCIFNRAPGVQPATIHSLQSMNSHHNANNRDDHDEDGEREERKDC